MSGQSIAHHDRFCTHASLAAQGLAICGRESPLLSKRTTNSSKSTALLRIARGDFFVPVGLGAVALAEARFRTGARFEKDFDKVTRGRPWTCGYVSQWAETGHTF